MVHRNQNMHRTVALVVGNEDRQAESSFIRDGARVQLLVEGNFQMFLRKQVEKLVEGVMRVGSPFPVDLYDVGQLSVKTTNETGERRICVNHRPIFPVVLVQAELEFSAGWIAERSSGEQHTFTILTLRTPPRLLDYRPVN